MKKILGLIILLMIFLAGTVLAANVAYVVKDSADSYVINELNYMGLSYDVIKESSISSTDFSEYEMILAGDDNFDNPEDIPVTEYKSLILNHYNFYRTGTITYDYQWGWSWRRGAQGSPSKIQIDNKNISITEGVSEFFNAYTVNNLDVKAYYLSGKKATGTKFIASIDGSAHTSADSALAVVYPGAEMLSGKTAEARSLFFGLTDGEYWTQDSKQLFRNSLTWVLIGEDIDEDGFYTDDDCNDADSTINPNADELAYDSIDQDCDGLDLTDVDEDGYDSDIVEGLDCDDNNPIINPDNPDKTQNCINDAPKIDRVDMKVNYQEGELAEIIVEASDPENDSLTYSINDSRFNASDNAFTWQTGYEDSGTYTFSVRASDSEFTTSKAVSFIIINKNRAPLYNNIPNQTWDEDTSIVLNLSDYFYDEDGNTLSYGIADTSSDTNIIASKTGEIINFTIKENWFGEDWIIFYAFDGMYRTNSNNITLTVNPVNDPPTLKENIPNQTWNEDADLTINLSDYFEDADGDLAYVITGNSNINAEFNGSLATFSHNANWFGNEDVTINASDSVYNIQSNLFNLKVLPINDAPVLDNIEDINVLTGDLVNITPSASDAEGDSMIFSFDSHLNLDGEWQTTENDTGNHIVKVSVSDGVNSDFQNVNIYVFQKILINEMVVDPNAGDNEWIELYNPSDSDFNLDSCEIRDGADNKIIVSGIINKKSFRVFEISTKLNNPRDIVKLSCFGELVDSVTYGEWDDGNSEDNAPVPIDGESIGRNPDGKDTDKDSEDFAVFSLPTKNLPSSADMISPTVQLLSPSDGETFTDTRDVTFEFTANDNTNNLNCSLLINSGKVDTKTVESGVNDNLTASNLIDGLYSWNVECSDADNTASALSNRNFTISAPDNPILNSIGDKTASESQLLKFVISATDSDGGSLTFSVENKPIGAVFTDNLNGTATFAWTPDYNQSGTYDVKFKVKDTTDLIDSKTIKISVGETKEPPKFSDIDRCDITNSSLEITIKDPDKGDEFDVGETINIKAEIKNQYSEKLDVDVNAYLYDANEEEVLEDAKDKLKVRSGDKESIEFELKIPDDVKENDFYIFVKAEGENGETLCNEEKVMIDIERKQDDLIINSIEISPEIARPGDSIDIKVEVKNIGSDEQEDVYVLVENKELGISKKSEEFDIEEFDEDDTETALLSIDIPENAEEKEYELKVSVFFSNENSFKTQSFSVLGGVSTLSSLNETGTGGIILLGTKGTEKEGLKSETKDVQKLFSEESASKQKSSKNILFLIIGAIILIVLVIIVIKMALYSSKE